MVAAYSPNLHEYATLQKGKPKWTGVVKTLESSLGEPYRHEDPKRFFVCPIADLFHEDVPFSFVDQVMATIRNSSRHTFGLLTKRASRMAEYYQSRRVPDNLWPGVSVELDAETCRIDDLLQIEAGVRWVSAEPLLGPLSLEKFLGSDRINWVAAGPEIGPGARSCQDSWMRQIRDECYAAGVPFFTKWIIDGQQYRQQPAV